MVKIRLATQTIEGVTATSAGAGDAGKGVLLNASGLVDSSMIAGDNPIIEQQVIAALPGGLVVTLAKPTVGIYLFTVFYDSVGGEASSERVYINGLLAEKSLTATPADYSVTGANEITFVAGAVVAGDKITVTCMDG